ncbi:hypothetical protein Tsubulata_018838, partial [Turnera subulata]
MYNIFSRLPAKSLARFKCVSKSMCALFSNPMFVKLHRHKAVILRDPNPILKLDSKLFIVDDDDEEWRKARRLQLPFTSSLDKVELSGSCNGLLCISDQQCNEDIILFNHTIGGFKKLPLPDFDVPTIESKCFTTVGFGYHHGEDDYKVIRCVYLYDKPFIDIDSYGCEARIYSLNTNEWKKIGSVPFHLGYRAGIWLGNEFIVWKATCGFGRTVRFQIASFDMDREEFKEIPQPNSSNYSDEKSMEVAMFGGCLSIFYQSRTDGVDIWSMKDNGWVLLYVITRPDHIIDDYYMFLKPLLILKNGEILLEAGDRER